MGLFFLDKVSCLHDANNFLHSMRKGTGASEKAATAMAAPVSG
jgi:hypothetical protein